MIKSLVRWVVITSVTKDDKDFPLHKVTYIAKAGDALAWYPYGFHANPGPAALALMLAVNSDAENRVMFPGSPKERISDDLPTPLAEGEILIYNPITKSYVHLKEDGSIDIDSKLDINITAANDLTATVAGDTTITSTGPIDIDSSGAITVDSVGSTTITGTGTVKIDGNTVVDLDAALVKGHNGGAIEALCNETFIALFNAHIHSTPSSGNTFAPTIAAAVGTDTTTVLKGE